MACDELTGFVMACCMVRPDGIHSLAPSSVKKKLKDKGFAAKVNRDDVYQGAERLGTNLDEHIQLVIDALKPHAEELGIAGPKRIVSLTAHRLWNGASEGRRFSMSEQTDWWRTFFSGLMVECWLMATIGRTNPARGRLHPGIARCAGAGQNTRCPVRRRSPQPCPGRSRLRHDRGRHIDRFS